MTKRQILVETRDYYGADPNGLRGLNPRGSCMNITEDGKMCAFGRCLIDPKSMRSAYASVRGAFKDDESLNALLKPEYRGHTRMFWVFIQRFHDSDTNWTRKGISPHGQGVYDTLQQMFSAKEVTL